MLWQLLHETSFCACLPAVQNARLRLLLWQGRHTAACLSGATPFLNGFSGLAFMGSCKCADASPWHAWHMLPIASFFAPWAVSSIEFCLSSWQLAQIGLTLSAAVGAGAGAGACASATG